MQSYWAGVINEGFPPSCLLSVSSLRSGARNYLRLLWLSKASNNKPSTTASIFYNFLRDFALRYTYQLPLFKYENIYLHMTNKLRLINACMSRQRQ